MNWTAVCLMGFSLCFSFCFLAAMGASIFPPSPCPFCLEPANHGTVSYKTRLLSRRVYRYCGLSLESDEGTPLSLMVGRRSGGLISDMICFHNAPRSQLGEGSSLHLFPTSPPQICRLQTPERTLVMGFFFIHPHRS